MEAVALDIQESRMGTPIEHAENSVKIHGGDIEDYLSIHEVIDSSKIAYSNLDHRILTHNTWFIEYILPKIFGSYIVITMNNGEHKNIAVSQIGIEHVMEDLGYVPNVLENLIKPPTLSGLLYTRIPDGRIPYSS